MYLLDFNEMDEATRKAVIKFWKAYYSGLIYDEESLRTSMKEFLGNNQSENKNKKPVKIKKLEFRE